MTVNQTIAFVGNTSWGLFQFRLPVMRYLQEKGYRVVAIAPRDAFSSGLIAAGIPFYHLPLNNYSTNPLREWRHILTFRQLYKKTSPDLIFHYTIKPNVYGTLAARSLGIPAIAVTTGIGHLPLAPNRLIRGVLGQLYRLSGKVSRETWFLNQSDLDYFLQRRLVPADRARILPGEGVDVLHYHYVYRNERPGMQTTFLFMGRLLRDKGIYELVQAARRLLRAGANVHFQVLGPIDPSNPQSVSFEELMQWQAEDLFEYLGEAADVRPYLAKADALVLPSYREGLSRSLMEAASTGLPIIASDVPGCRETVTPGQNGFRCIPRNVGSLLDQLLHFHELPVEQKRLMGVRSRQKALEAFDQNLILPYYQQAIERALGPAPRRSAKKVARV